MDITLYLRYKKPAMSPFATAMFSALRHTAMFSALRHTAMFSALRHTAMFSALRHTAMFSALRQIMSIEPHLNFRLQLGYS